MTKPITLGEIRVFDDGDGVIDPAKDKITGLYNEEPIPVDSFSSDPRIQEVLKNLNIESLQGLSLSKAAQFISDLSFAKKLAREGKVEEVEAFIPQMLRRATGSKLSLEAIKAQVDLIQQGMERAICHPNGEQRSCDKLEWSKSLIATERQITKIIHDALLNGVRVHFNEAARKAAAGEEVHPDDSLAVKFARQAEQAFGIDANPVEKGVAEIQDQYWQNNPKKYAEVLAIEEKARQRWKAEEARQIKEGEAAAKMAEEREKRWVKEHGPELERRREAEIRAAEQAEAREKEYLKRYGEDTDATQEILGTDFKMDGDIEKNLDRIDPRQRYRIFEAMAWIQPIPDKKTANHILIEVLKEFNHRYLSRTELESIIAKAISNK